MFVQKCFSTRKSFVTIKLWPKKILSEKMSSPKYSHTVKFECKKFWPRKNLSQEEFGSKQIQIKKN